MEEAKLENECSGAYLFRQFVEDEVKGLTYLVFVPEIGIVEERNGANSLEALENTIKLEEINGKSVSSHLKKICKEKPKTREEVDELVLIPVNEGTQIPDELDRIEDSIDPREEIFFEREIPETPVNVNPSVREETFPSQRVHVVKKGETLYRISKKYGITVQQLKDWNGLQSNTIYRNDRLAVSGASFNRAPAPYEETLTDKNIPMWHVTDGTHKVARGETIAYIAMLYGYTEKRFRELNGLRNGEVVYEGQLLKTQDCDRYDGQDQGETVVYEKNVPYRSNPKSGTDESEFFTNPARNTPVFYDLPESGNYKNTKRDRQITVDPELTPKGYEGESTRIPSRPNGKRTSHVVKDGDTLYSLALQYGVSVEHIRQINNMEANEILIPHQKIYID